MRDESTLIHCEHVSERTFEEVVTSFEMAVGQITRSNDLFERAFEEDVTSFEMAVGQITSAVLQQIVTASTDERDFETRIRAFEGPSGFMRFLDIDHGAWLARIGRTVRCKLYILGNPLIARTMLEHELAVGWHVPLRAMIFEDPQTGKARLAYDLDRKSTRLNS